ncbi:hypothetical protein GCM10007989_25880 [Devosia pacifica]|uniref:histidine kinase n=1 Tax=Devosia pacifica TaxID=1335967 RepID=A0A918S9U1_9HYPH|nr:HAMP domain-containing sensor histidine kinase [Devosia pacifica]GHA29136.1 hypothetical protein GCM10007989_25880 [Devosia pacifica]
MGSSVNTEADADRFGVGAAGTQEAKTAGFKPFFSFVRHIDTTTRTVALTAFTAAALFTLTEIVQSLEAADRELRTASHELSTELQSLSESAAARRLRTLKASLGSGVSVSLYQEADASMLPSIGYLVEAGALGTLAIERDTASVAARAAPSGVAAFLAAGLFTLGSGMIGRRKRKGAVVRDHSLDLSSFVGAIPFGVACWTKTGRMTVCNEVYRGHIETATYGSAFDLNYYDALKRLSQGGYIKMVDAGANNDRALEVHREDGHCLLIEERRIGTGFITLVSDVTEQKRQDDLLAAVREEQRLLARRYHQEKLRAEAASRSKTNFLAHLSHDIRTPLNHIIGFAELIGHETYGPLGDKRYLDYVGNIKSSGRHLLASFAAILELAELEGGRRLLKSEPIDLDALLERVAQRYQPKARQAGVRFTLGARCESQIAGDTVSIERMLGNALDNAVRFTPTGGEVTLAAYCGRDGVVIEVSDTGVGMAEERLENLSQPFALGDASFTREGVGPGLGLPIARAIAELSGGHMAIDSSLALGTTVAFSLPLQHDEDTAVMHAAE